MTQMPQMTSEEWRVRSRISDAKMGFVTFSAGNPAWRMARRRLVREAEESGLFLKVCGYGWKDLKPLCSNKEIDFIESHSKGFGYWYWKPKAVMKFLRDNPNCDYVLYLDSGCELNINNDSLKKFYEYLDLAEASGAVVFSLDLIEEEWTQQTTLKALDATEQEKKSSQIMATGFLLSREFAFNFCPLWEKSMADSEWQFLMDDQSGTPRISIFKAHRHDQSLFSILMKRQSGISVKPNSDVYFAPDWKQGFKYPIWTIRNRTSIKREEQRGLILLFVFLQKGMNRIFNNLAQRKG